MQLVDTHCHIHEILGAAGPVTQKKWASAGNPDPDDVITNARKAGVGNLICVGTTVIDSQLAVNFVQARRNCWASIGIHPHEAQGYNGDQQALAAFSTFATQPKVVAVGECGLDYFYHHSPKKEQATILRFQIELALQHNLPLIFHVREAFNDFWPIFDSYPGIRGVIHSFTATQKELDEILSRGLFVGLNGIVTFSKQQSQLAAVKAVPLTNMLLETDAPFLTPTPYRGSICEPKHVLATAQFLAALRHESLEQIAQATTSNARKLFKLT